MYLTARLIALSIYCAILVGFCISISKIKYTRFQLFLYVLVLATMGFFYVPDISSDLYRIRDLLPIYLHFPWSTLISGETPVANVYYHLVSHLGDGRWLPAITAFLTYSFCFTILYQSTKKYNLSRGMVALILFFFMSRGLLMMTIANIRTMLSLSILAYCIYKETVEKKSLITYFPLLLLAALTHSATMANTMIYLSFYILYGIRSRNLLSNLIQGFMFVVGGGFFLVTYIQRAFLRGQGYLSSSQEGTGFFYIWEFAFSITLLLFTLAIIIYFLTSKSVHQAQKDTSGKKLISYIVYLACINLLMCFVEFNIAYRTSWLVAILDMPLLAILFGNSGLPRRKWVLLKYIVFIFSWVLLVAVCARGDLCSLKFFEYL